MSGPSNPASVIGGSEMETGVRRWLVNASQWNPSEDQFASILSLFPADEQGAITRYKKFDDRKRALISRLLQYSLVHEVLGIPFDKIIIHRTVEGKPYLKSCIDFPYPNFNFNASHHGDYVGIASEPWCLVGLDIVSITIPQQDTVLEFISNFSSYLTASEWKNIVNAGSSEEKLADFFRYWSLKEAFVKAIGSGLGYGLHMHRLEFHHTNWTSITVYIDGVESRAWKFSLHKIDERHWTSIAKGLPNQTDEQRYCRNWSNPEIRFSLLTVDQLIRNLIQETGH